MDNYKEVKNYIHNDLKITKEDIQGIIQNTLTREIRKYINDEFELERFMYDIIRTTIYKDKDIFAKTIFDMSSMIKDKVTEVIVKEVKNKVEISLRPDET